MPVTTEKTRAKSNKAAGSKSAAASKKGKSAGAAKRGRTAAPVESDPAATTPVAAEPAHYPEDPYVSEARRQAIAELAYRKAERRGFSPGHELDDWLEAEREVSGAQPPSSR